jgi:hypothetical protein
MRKVKNIERDGRMMDRRSYRHDPRRAQRRAASYLAMRTPAWKVFQTGVLLCDATPGWQSH